MDPPWPCVHWSVIGAACASCHCHGHNRRQVLFDGKLQGESWQSDEGRDGQGITAGPGRLAEHQQHMQHNIPDSFRQEWMQYISGGPNQLGWHAKCGRTSGVDLSQADCQLCMQSRCMARWHRRSRRGRWGGCMQSWTGSSSGKSRSTARTDASSWVKRCAAEWMFQAPYMPCNPTSSVQGGHAMSSASMPFAGRCLGSQ